MITQETRTKTLLRKSIERLSKENADLREQLSALQEESDRTREVELQKLRELDELTQELSRLKKTYTVTVELLQKSKEGFEKERKRYFDLRRNFKKAMKMV